MTPWEDRQEHVNNSPEGGEPSENKQRGMCSVIRIHQSFLMSRFRSENVWAIILVDSRVRNFNRNHKDLPYTTKQCELYHQRYEKPSKNLQQVNGIS